MKVKKRYQYRFRLIALLILLFVCGTVWIMLSACAVNHKKEDKKNVTSEMEFIDSKNFDKKFSYALDSDLPTVTLNFPAPTTLNNIPKRLDKWFCMVENYGGNVSVVPVGGQEKTRGIVTEIISIIVGSYSLIKDKLMYKPVEDYDVTIYYQPRTGNISEVLFTQRPSSKQE